MRQRWRGSESEERAAAGRVGLVQAGLLIVLIVVVSQLWLLTVGLEELLAGHYAALGSLVALSAAAFLVALFVFKLVQRER